MNTSHDTIERAAAAAFNKQSTVFDKLYSRDRIVQYKRERVRAHINAFLQPGSRILELNAGTGEDAVYFGRKGHFVHATDISAGMQEVLAEKIQTAQLLKQVSHERCSFSRLEALHERGPYDLVFSNFAGLNCTDKLDKVLSDLPALVKPGGYASLVILPKFCLWEFLLLFKGRIRTAFRRFSGRKGTSAHIEGEYFRCWYYNPSFVRKKLGPDFELVNLEGLCTLVPPSYIEGFADKHPKWFSFLEKKEARLKGRWPWRAVGDYYIITLKKKNGEGH